MAPAKKLGTSIAKDVGWVGVGGGGSSSSSGCFGCCTSLSLKTSGFKTCGLNSLGLKASSFQASGLLTSSF